MSEQSRLKVAIYTRSATNTDYDRAICRAQIRCLSSFATINEQDVYKIYMDIGYSGMNLDRPGLQELLKDAKDLKFVIIYSIDIARISRSLIELFDMLKDLKDRGIQWQVINLKPKQVIELLNQG